MRTKSAPYKNISPPIIVTSPWRIKKVKSLPDYTLEVQFIDGTLGTIFMKKLIFSPKAGVFAALKDPAIFNQVHIEYGATTWPGEIDLAPDAMYEEIKKKGIWVLT